MRRWAENLKNPQVAILGVLCTIFFLLFLVKAFSALTSRGETRPYEVAPNPMLVTSSEPSIVSENYLRPIPDDADLDAVYALVDRLQPVLLGPQDPNTVVESVATNRRGPFASSVSEFRAAVAAAAYVPAAGRKPTFTLVGFEDGAKGTVTIKARYRNDQEQVDASWLVSVGSVASLTPAAPTAAAPGVQTGANQYVVTDVTYSFSGA